MVRGELEQQVLVVVELYRLDQPLLRANPIPVQLIRGLGDHPEVLVRLMAVLVVV